MNSIENHTINYKNIDKTTNWDEKIEMLYEQQIQTWQMARNHYSHFNSVISRFLHIDDSEIIIQHNPARVRSTCADLSKKTIENRKCFLCSSNLPPEQKGLVVLDKYLVLVNPFPVFKRHLTISDFEHIPQRLENRIINMLELTKLLPSYTIFYNGPSSGASAPDHFHFQAAGKGSLPLEKEIQNLIPDKKEILINKEDIQIYSVEKFLRNCIVIESGWKEPIDYFYEQIMKILPCHEEFKEPLINVLAFYNEKYIFTIYPRESQRPTCYYKEDESRIIVSPASVEMAGILVTPREEDFNKINSDDIRKIYTEVSINNDKFKIIKTKIRSII